MSLGDIQQAILSLITNHINADGVSPSQPEIARAFGFKGVRAVQHHL
ncbi:repressor LexA, partial [Xylella fastidiosa subsp. multiplex]|nr:repressor LexA [Xylella fastidiosa subsp. multiplex]